jgi:hypothetical protein
MIIEKIYSILENSMELKMIYFHVLMMINDDTSQNSFTKNLYEN